MKKTQQPVVAILVLIKTFKGQIKIIYLVFQNKCFHELILNRISNGYSSETQWMDETYIN